MNDWFEWNCVRCARYGIHVSELSPLTLPSEYMTNTTPLTGHHPNLD